MEKSNKRISVANVIKRIKIILEHNNRTTMKAFKIFKGDCSDDIDRIHIRIKNNKLFWIHLLSFADAIKSMDFKLSWLSRDSFKDQKTQCTLTIMRDRR